MEWKDILGYEDRYQASRDGKIKTKKTGLVRSGHPSKNGYLTVSLSRKTYTIHSLIAITFIGPYPPGKEVRHKDGNRTHNNVDNLEYGTRSQNMQDAVRHGTQSPGGPHEKCHRGLHNLSEPGNVAVSNGTRRCRPCVREWQRKRRNAAKSS